MVGSTAMTMEVFKRFMEGDYTQATIKQFEVMLHHIHLEKGNAWSCLQVMFIVFVYYLSITSLLSVIDQTNPQY